MDWTNVDLKSSEIDSNIVDSYSFSQLLLEIHCNLTEINEKTVTRHFRDALNARRHSAMEVFEANLENIINHALNDKSND